MRNLMADQAANVGQGTAAAHGFAVRPAGRFLVFAAALLLTACGQTGALYFDEAPPADQLPPSKKTQPVSTIPQPVSGEAQSKNGAE